MTITADMFPDVRDFGDFRARAEAAWEVFIDNAEHLSLRFSVLDRYDSTPDGIVAASGSRQQNDVNYTAQFVWSF